MKLNSSIKKFITNRWVLNVISVLALFNIIGYMVLGNFNYVLYFIVFAVLVRYFSKNMTIVLGVPLIMTNLLALKNNGIEGMTNNSNSNNKNSIIDNINSNSNNNTSNTNGNNNQMLKNAIMNKKDGKTGQGLQMRNIETENGNENSNMATQISGGEQQGFEPGRQKNRGHEIDYATTIEDAYDQLNSILGSDGVQRLTSDTQNLMKQQMQLAEAMKSMQPMVESIAPMVKNLQGMMGQLGDGKEGLNGLMDLAKKFSGQSPVQG